MPTRDGLHGARYGEVLLVSSHLTHFEAAVYNTLDLNECPDDLWRQLDADAIKDKFKAKAAILNGPRYFLMDSITITSQVESEPVTFGALQMRRMATVRIPLRMMLGGMKRRPYTENVVERTTVYTYAAGRDVYELVAPSGAMYTMQSYSLQVDPSLTEESLKTLGDRLDVPPGWIYRVRHLTDAFLLRANGQAHLIQDDFENSYQRMD